jgi:twitching motility two-component system response regulator PilG
MDGYQICQVIKRRPASRHIPVVMLSGRDGFFDKVRGRMVGSTQYVTKPFDPAQLVKAVTKHLAQPRRAQT